MNDMDNTGKLYELEKQIENLSRLIEINAIINSTLNINKLLSLLMEMIKDIMNTETSSLLLYEEEREELVFKVALGEAGDELREKYCVKLGQGIAGWVALNRKELLVNDVYNDDRFDPTYDKSTGFVTRAILCTPLLFKGKLLGVIQAINPLNRDGFDDQDMELFRSFSNQAALAVQNAIIFKKSIEDERIESELKAAKKINESLAPRLDFKNDRFSIAARYIPAREVGGGFHFFRESEYGVYSIIMGYMDTRGIPGAMKASTYSGIVRAMFELNIKNPDEMVNIMGRLCHDESDHRGFSLFIGVIDTNREKIRFVNSGDIRAVMVRNHRIGFLRFRDRCDGFIGEKRFSAREIKFSLKKGDRFVLFSNSLAELKNDRGKKFNLSGIIDFIEKDNDISMGIIETLIGNIFSNTCLSERKSDIAVATFAVH